MPIYFVTCVVALVLLLCYLFRKDKRVFQALSKFSSVPVLPVFGHALSLIPAYTQRDRLFLQFGDYVKHYGTSLTFWFFNHPYLTLLEPNDVEKVLSSSVHINKGRDYEYLETWLGTGLLTAKHGKWHRRRKLLTPAFHFKILEDFVPIFNTQAKVLVRVLKEHQLNVKSFFDITPFFSRCTLDIICETAMGEKINAQTGKGEDYVNAVSRMSELLITKAMNPLYHNELLWNIIGHGKIEKRCLAMLHGFTEQVIRNRKLERKQNPEQFDPEGINNPEGVKQRKAFLDLLLDLQENDGLSDADIREEVDTFMFEGHDTTSANLVWTIFTLACYPKCQDKLHQELDRVLGNDCDRDITTNDVKELKYLECCIKETLRLFPSVAFIMRKIEEDILLDDKRIIPGGITLSMVPFFQHRLAKLFPNPEVFDPERFTTENSVGRHPYAYIPFSAGPRNCIGQRFALLEEKVILARLFKNFRVEVMDSMDTVSPIPDIVLRPKNGMKVRLISRNE